MKSPRPDSPIPSLPTIRTIRVESARNRDDFPSAAVRHQSASTPRESSAVLHSGSSPIFPSRTTFDNRDPASFPVPQRISLKPIVPNSRHSLREGPSSLRPSVLPSYRNDILSQSPSKCLGNHDLSLTSASSSSSLSTLGDEEGETRNSEQTEIDIISNKISETDEPPDDEEKSPGGLFIRPREIPAKVAAVSSDSSRLEGWKCEKNFEKASALNEMKIWPQVLLSVVASLAHLSLGTVLAYPAISNPSLLATIENPTSGQELILFNQSFNGSEYNSNSSPPPNDVFLYEDFDTSGTEDPGSMSSNIFEPFGGSSNESNLNQSTGEPTPSSAPLSGIFSPITITPNQAAWLASIQSIGGIFGSMLCGTLLALVGQRRAILIIAPILLSTWLTIWIAPSYIFLLGARIIAGVCIGVLGTGAQVYIVETAHESIRGSLYIVSDLYVGLGLLFTYALGASDLGWRWVAFIIGFTTIVPLMVGLSFFPDSPRWLAMKDRKDDALKSLQFLRGNSYDVSREFESIQNVCSKYSQRTVMEQLRMLRKPSVYRPFFTSCSVFTLCQLSGPYVVYSYTVYIFEVANVGFNPRISAVIIGVARLIGSVIGIMVIEKAGRKIPLMAGGVSLAISLTAFGIFFFIKDKDPDLASSLGWLPLTVMILYIITVGVAVSPIPFLLSTELQPLSFRSVGSSASKAVFFLSGMVSTYTFPVLSSSIGPAITFWLYASSALAMVVLVWLIVPETKGRTLEEIEDYYNRKQTT